MEKSRKLKGRRTEVEVNSGQVQGHEGPSQRPTTPRKGRRTTEPEENAPNSDLSNEFQRKLRLSYPERVINGHGKKLTKQRTIDRVDGPAVAGTEQKDRVQKWREESADPKGKFKNKNTESPSRQQPDRAVRDMIPLTRPVFERGTSRFAKPNPKSTQDQMKTMVESRESEPSSLMEVSRRLKTQGVGPARRNSRELLRIAARNAAPGGRSEHDLPKRPIMDLLSSTTFNMPSASEAYFDRDMGRAELIYYNEQETLRGRNSSVMTSALAKPKPRTTGGKIPGSDEGPGTQTSSGQGHRRKHSQVQWDYSSLKVANLSLDAKTGDLQDLFPSALSVTKPVREVEPVSGALVSFAFVLFSSTEDAAEALRKRQGYLVGGQRLSLTYRQYSAVR